MKSTQDLKSAGSSTAFTGRWKTGCRVILPIAVIALWLSFQSKAFCSTRSIGVKNSSGRSGVIYLPKNYDALNASGKRFPVMIAFHGTGGSGQDMVNTFQGLADQKDFIIVAPDSRRSPAGQFTWEVCPARDPQSPYGEYTEDLFHAVNCLNELAAIPGIHLDNGNGIAVGYSGGGSSAPYFASYVKCFPSFAVLHGGVLPFGMGAEHPNGWFSTGNSDPIRSVAQVQSDKAQAENVIKCKYDFNSFPGGHEISQAEQAAVVQWWLNQVTPQPPEQPVTTPATWPNSLTGVTGKLKLIPAQTYQRGNGTGDPLRWYESAPVQAVTLSGYYVAVNATTKAQWDVVRNWGLSHGYADLAEGVGKASDHPVQTVSWYDVVKWANAASERDGLTPCYRVDGVVYQTGKSDDVVCAWDANGYRLPTEAEWEVAARGGLTGKRFPLGDTISQNQANYKASKNDAYDLSGSVNDYSPSYTSGGKPYTSPVGSFAPNGYGLYDMAGNVAQWCWDCFGPYSAYTAGRDPRGANKSFLRIMRGGFWNNVSGLATCSFRITYPPSEVDPSIGFRLVRGQTLNGEGSSNPGDGMSTVTFKDTTAPVLKLPANMTVLATSGSGAIVSYPAATASDNVSTNPTITYSKASGSLFPIGTTGVAVTAADAAGNVSSGTFAVTVVVPVAGAEGTFVPIQAGKYQRGDNLDGNPYARVQTVTLSAYCISVNDTTKAQWDVVRSWGLSHGYTDLSGGIGKDSNHPVVCVSWYDAVKWANAASERDGLTPCYKLGGVVYRTGISDSPVCDWSVNGYRLPTEAEWEVAARGGLTGKRFPWGDTISPNQANYSGDGTYRAGNPPFTSPVGSFPANGYGLYDMAGNASQWCWDWASGDTYDGGADGGTNPKGPSVGWNNLRVVRGGGYYDEERYLSFAQRMCKNPSGSFDVGFRLARGAVMDSTSSVLTTTNGANNVGSGTFTVTVSDTTAPVLSIPATANVTVSASSSSGAIVNYPAATATDNVTARPKIAYSKASGSLFPIGNTTVVVTATDDAKNISSGTFTVTVAPLNTNTSGSSTKPSSGKDTNGAPTSGAVSSGTVAVKPVGRTNGLFTVNSRLGWQDTGVDVVASGCLTVTAVSGSWTVDAVHYKPVGALGHLDDGSTNLKNWAFLKEAPQFHFGAMLGSIVPAGKKPTDDVEKLFFVGDNFSAPPEASGRLWLRINEMVRSEGDNAGAITVQIAAMPTQPVKPVEVDPSSDPSLITLLPFDSSDPNGTSTKDTSGHGNDGKLVNMVQSSWVEGHTGKGLVFDGVNDFVQIKNVTTPDFTLACWIKTSQTFPQAEQAYGGAGIMWSDVGGLKKHDFTLAGTRDKNGINRISFFVGITENTISGVTPINTGKWVHVAVTRNGTTGKVKVYVNGMLDGAGGATTEALTDNPVINIGGNPYNKHYFDGAIDDVRIYSRELSDNDVRNLALGLIKSSVIGD
ncbi:MAG: SUMF1/EgtB/PvdO family nonheme iron enzyme [Verrucomicrobiota bacterium]